MNDQCEISERAREYLKIKLAECKFILKKTKRKRRIIKILGTSIQVLATKTIIIYLIQYCSLLHCSIHLLYSAAHCPSHCPLWCKTAAAGSQRA